MTLDRLLVNKETLGAELYGKRSVELTVTSQGPPARSTPRAHSLALGLEPRAGRRRGGGTTGREAAGVEAQTGVRIDGPKGGELGLFQNSKTN